MANTYANYQISDISMMYGAHKCGPARRFQRDGLASGFSDGFLGPNYIKEGGNVAAVAFLIIFGALDLQGTNHNLIGKDSMEHTINHTTVTNVGQNLSCIFNFEQHIQRWSGSKGCFLKFTLRRGVGPLNLFGFRLKRFDSVVNKPYKLNHIRLNPDFSGPLPYVEYT